MALKKEHPLISEEDYLQGELKSHIKHEYVDGQVYAMGGVSRNHSHLTSTISREFGTCLKGKSCNAHPADFQVKIGTKYFYPDVLVECDQGGDDYFTENPIIIVEVLSPSTRRYDEITKLRAYLTIPSLKECVLVNQDMVRVEVFRRVEEFWSSTIYNLGDDVCFESIGLTLAVEEIYEQVDNEDMQKFLATKGEEGLT